MHIYNHIYIFLNPYGTSKSSKYATRCTTFHKDDVINNNPAGYVVIPNINEMTKKLLTHLIFQFDLIFFWKNLDSKSKLYAYI